LPSLAGAVIAIAILASDPRQFLDRGYFFAVDALLACLLVGHLVGWRRAITAREQAVARSARLEAEMLKRQLQPHVVMNTLTALGGWIEEDPATAVRMIEALADELRMLTRIADRRLIPLADELRLCRAHLETLALRRETRYRLETDGVDEAEQVPPALLHTLVENAATHRPNAARDVTMRLEASRCDGRTRYVFTSAYDPRAPEVGAPGTGTRYLTARLREAWGDDWTLDQEAVGDSWRVVIDVPGGTS
jgi:LytS/YehU family sensor histidine kinase